MGSVYSSLGFTEHSSWDDKYTMQTETVSNIPVLWEEPTEAKKRKLVIWLPGFTASKEVVHDQLSHLAASGYVALSFDPVDHGERSRSSAQEVIDPTTGRFRSQTDGKIYRHFWSIEAETAAEVPIIIDWAIAKLAVEALVGIGGISMGGDIAVVAAGLDRRITVVAACIATADWLKPGSMFALSAPNATIQAQYERYNPLTNLARYQHCPAMSFQCGAADPMVPPDGAARFVQALTTTYAACPEKLEIYLEAGVAHEFTETMWLNSLRWLKRFLLY
jgi:dienelactone hydrolase